MSSLPGVGSTRIGVGGGVHAVPFFVHDNGGVAPIGASSVAFELVGTSTICSGSAIAACIVGIFIPSRVNYDHLGLVSITSNRENAEQEATDTFATTHRYSPVEPIIPGVVSLAFFDNIKDLVGLVPASYYHRRSPL
jgi:hypothetical protein